MLVEENVSRDHACSGFVSHRSTLRQKITPQTVLFYCRKWRDLTLMWGQIRSTRRFSALGEFANSRDSSPLHVNSREFCMSHVNSFLSGQICPPVHIIYALFIYLFLRTKINISRAARISGYPPNCISAVCRPFLMYLRPKLSSFQGESD